MEKINVDWLTCTFIMIVLFSLCFCCHSYTCTFIDVINIDII